MRYTINRNTKSYKTCVSFSVSPRKTCRNTFCISKKATERYTQSISSSISKDILFLFSIETLVKKNKTYIFFGVFWGYTMLCLQCIQLQPITLKHTQIVYTSPILLTHGIPHPAPCGYTPDSHSWHLPIDILLTRMLSVSVSYLRLEIN